MGNRKNQRLHNTFQQKHYKTLTKHTPTDTQEDFLITSAVLLGIIIGIIGTSTLFLIFG